MTAPKRDWFRRYRRHWMGLLIGLLLFVVLLQSFLLFEQRTASHETEAQSAKLLTRFLQGDTTQLSGASGVHIRMQNVRFKWSDKVYLDMDNMAVRAVPTEGNTVDFDDLNSFYLAMQQSVVVIKPKVLEGMFNESVFNYPGSKLRDLKVALTRSDNNERVVSIKGSVNVGIWIAFEMTTRLTVDTKTNTLVMEADHLKVLGVLPVLHLTKWKPFSLESLISLPPNKTLIVDGNRLMVKPFGLFPPPRVNGMMSNVRIDDDGIRLVFAGNPIPAPKSIARNYVYLRGGSSQFGHFRMLDTDILILDQNPANPFVFSLVHYADMVPRSKIEVHDTRSVLVTMPDFSSQ